MSTTPTTATKRTRVFALAGNLAVHDLTPDERLELATAVPELLDKLRDAEAAFIKLANSTREHGDRAAVALAGQAERIEALEAELAAVTQELVVGNQVSGQLVAEGNRMSARIADLEANPDEHLVEATSRLEAARECLAEILALVMPDLEGEMIRNWIHADLVAAVRAVVAARDEHRRDFAAASEQAVEAQAEVARLRVAPAVARGLVLLARHLDEGGHDWGGGTDMPDVKAAEAWIAAVAR